MLSFLKVSICERYGPGRQYQAASDAGIPEGTLSRIVNGRKAPTPEERSALSSALGVPQRDLFPGQRGEQENAA